MDPAQIPLLEGDVQGPENASPAAGAFKLQEAKRLVALSWPLCAEQVLTYGATLITMSMVGRLGAFPYSVLVLATAVTNITGLSLIIGIAGGVDTFASQAFGAGEPALLGVVLQRALLVNLVACLPPALLWACAGERLLWWAEDPAMAAAAMRYAKLWSPVLVLHGSSQCVYRYLVAQGIAKPSMVAGALCCVAALPLNWLFIFKLGWGLHGAVAATIAIEAAYLAALLTSALVTNSATPLGARPLTGSRKEALIGWGAHLRVAIPAAAMVAIEWWVWDIVNLIAGILPSPQVAVAVTGVAFNLNSLVWMVPNALGAAVCTHVGNALGAAQGHVAKLVVQVGLGMGTAAMTLAALGIQLAGPLLFRAFTSDADVIHASRIVVPPLAASVLACGAAALLQGILRGTGRQSVGVVANFVSYYAFGLPVIVAVAAETSWRVGGLWWALCGAAYLQALLLVVAVARFDWPAEVGRAAHRVAASRGVLE